MALTIAILVKEGKGLLELSHLVIRQLRGLSHIWRGKQSHSSQTQYQNSESQGVGGDLCFEGKRQILRVFCFAQQCTVPGPS